MSIMYIGAVAIRNAALFGESNTIIFLSDIFCHGDEVNLLRCSYNGIGQRDCAISETAGVICGGMYVVPIWRYIVLEVHSI